MNNLQKHRIVPGHMGGTYDSNNVAMLTITEHAEAHRLLYEKYGRWQDRLAWLGLSGQIGKEEIIRTKKSEGGKKLKNRPKSEEHIKKMIGNKNGRGCKGNKKSEQMKERLRQASLANPTRFWLGKAKSEDTKKKISESLKNKPWSEIRRKAHEEKKNNKRQEQS